MPVVTPNIGILASNDILAIDQASVDLVYALKEDEHKDLVERMESRHGLRQLTYMKELHMGNDRYHLIDIDQDDKEKMCIRDRLNIIPPHIMFFKWKSIRPVFLLLFSGLPRLSTDRSRELFRS